MGKVHEHSLHAEQITLDYEGHAFSTYIIKYIRSALIPFSEKKEATHGLAQEKRRIHQRENANGGGASSVEETSGGTQIS